MKITFHPSRKSILAKFAHELKACQGALDEEKAALSVAQEKANESKLHNPYLDQELLSIKSRVKHWEMQEASLHDTIGLLESSPEEHVTAEIEA